ncbi:oxidoreductase [Ureibacillus composti]
MGIFWTKNDIKDLTGKVAVVTGGNSGIGFQTSLALAEKGATVVLAVRNLNKGNDAIDRIKAVVPQASVNAIKLDLNDLKSVRAFASEFKNNYKSLSLLINNAGIMLPPYRSTEDGFESQFGVNYLGHFALTGLLLETLKKTPNSRVVSLGSLAAHKAKPEFSNIKGSKKYKPLKFYSQSKLACMFFAKELQYRLRSHQIACKSIACHPGISKTSLLSRNSKLTNKLTRYSVKLVGQSAEMGALPILYAATESSIRGGEYIGPDGRRGGKGYPTELDILDDLFVDHVANNLWTFSEKLTGVTYRF